MDSQDFGRDAIIGATSFGSPSKRLRLSGSDYLLLLLELQVYKYIFCLYCLNVLFHVRRCYLLI